MSGGGDVPTSTSTSWADMNDEEDDKLQFDNTTPPSSSSLPTSDNQAADDAPIASLASRISGLSTSNNPTSTSTPTPPTPAAPAVRPKPNTSNPLFGRALAGVKSDRAPAPPISDKKEESVAPAEDKKMVANLMDQNEGSLDGWRDPKVKNTPAPKENGNGNVHTNDNRAANGNEAVERSEIESAKMTETSDLISNDFQVEVKLADLQADPNSPLYSVQTFEQLNLHEDLMKGIYAVGFKKPSKIQERALPMLLSNPPRNLIGQSQSGTGKTAAFTLNMLSRVDPVLMTPQAICVAPSRELARQIQEVVDKIGQFTNIETALAVPGSWSRGVPIKKHILIGTPGTLVDMLSRGGRIFDPKQIRVFVLDEADEMIALQGLGDQTSRIKKALPPTVQNVLFSATFNDDVHQFAKMFAPEANQLFLKKEEVTVEAIKQLYLECDNEGSKFDALSALYDSLSIGQSIVFCKRKSTADDIASRLISEGHMVASLHGDKQSGERDEILDGFRNGKTKVLITTNVIARGIDIQQVNMVVNYDVPDKGPEGNFEPDVETYIHRIGRTGRFGRKGCSVIFVHDDRSRRDVEAIQQVLGKRMKRIDATSRTDIVQLEEALKAAMKGPN